MDGSGEEEAEAEMLVVKLTKLVLVLRAEFFDALLTEKIKRIKRKGTIFITP